MMAGMRSRVLIVPLTRCFVFDFIEDWRRNVYGVLSSISPYINVEVWPEILKLPMSCFDWSRRQYVGPCILDYLAEIFRDLRDSGVFVIGVGYIDAYDEGLNFVFGEASPSRGVAFVSAQRLDPIFYSTSEYAGKRYDLYVERVSKEILHELGHLLGLGHCSNPKCVMSFSNSVFEVDYKTMYYCERCSTKIAEVLS